MVNKELINLKQENRRLSSIIKNLDVRLDLAYEEQLKRCRGSNYSLIKDTQLKLKYYLIYASLPLSVDIGNIFMDLLVEQESCKDAMKENSKKIIAIRENKI